MKHFGVQFWVNDSEQFGLLRTLVSEVKSDKDAQEFRADSEWVKFIPERVKGKFCWPTTEERHEWLSVRDSKLIAVEPPSSQLSSTWDFFSVIDALEGGEYSILGCEMTSVKDVAEIHIDPRSYPYGGLGPFIALVEAFGFLVLGVNEYGKFLTREDSIEGRD